ncbi:MAG: head-tail connector protein [Terriglobales bacterium]
MSALIIETAPQCEPVSLADMKNYLRWTQSTEDTLIATLITAARECVESFTRRSFINKGHCMSLDSFPYYTDTVQSQQAYPPASYSLPRYSTTLWNYSQMIKLFASPLAKAAPTIQYVPSTGGARVTLTGTLDMADTTKDFLADNNSEPARLFPKAGQYWPACLYVPNAVQVHYVSGYNDDAAIAAAVTTWANAQSPAANQAAKDAYESTLRQADAPATAKVAIMKCVAEWWENREILSSLNLKEIPKHLEFMLWNLRVLDVAPTRG